jgi:hypothetical protein
MSPLLKLTNRLAADTLNDSTLRKQHAKTRRAVRFLVIINRSFVCFAKLTFIGQSCKLFSKKVKTGSSRRTH